MPLLCVAFKTTAGLLPQGQTGQNHAVHSLPHPARSLPDEDASPHDFIEDKIARANFSPGLSFAMMAMLHCGEISHLIFSLYRH